MPIYDFTCDACNKASTQMLSIARIESPDPCEHCGAQSLRQIITPPVVLIDGTDPSFPGASMKWDRDRQRTMAREQKTLKESGDYYSGKRHV